MRKNGLINPLVEKKDKGTAGDKGCMVLDVLDVERPITNMKIEVEEMWKD